MSRKVHLVNSFIGHGLSLNKPSLFWFRSELRGLIKFHELDIITTRPEQKLLVDYAACTRLHDPSLVSIVDCL
jgi:hypothetical protein